MADPGDFATLDIPSGLWAPVRWLVTHTLAFAGLLLAAWIADWVWVTRVWPDGVDGLVRVLDSELERMGQLDCWCGDLRKLAAVTGNGLYQAVFSWTGIEEMLGRISLGGPLSVPDSVIRSFFLGNTFFIQTIMVGTQLFGVKLMYLLTAGPAFLLFGVVGGIDGLALRTPRRFAGLGVSAGRYHRWKLAGLALLLVSGCAVLVIPVAHSGMTFQGLGLEVCFYAVCRKLVQWRR